MDTSFSFDVKITMPDKDYIINVNSKSYPQSVIPPPGERPSIEELKRRELEYYKKVSNGDIVYSYHYRVDGTNIFYNSFTELLDEI